MPQEIYRAAIMEINTYCTGRHGKAFESLSAAQQDEVLGDLETGKIALESVGASFFFGLLLVNTMEGFFADPIYGGNRDKIGWKLVGFPGVAAAYSDFIDKHNVPYHAEPVYLADLQPRIVGVDEHGHPRHVLLAKKH